MSRALFDFGHATAYAEIGRMIVAKARAGEVSTKDASTILLAIQAMLDERRQQKDAA